MTNPAAGPMYHSNPGNPAELIRVRQEITEPVTENGIVITDAGEDVEDGN